MKKDIKDYLHLYLGCECLVQFPEDRDGVKCILDGVSDECATFTNYAPDYYFDEPECGVKLALHPLSDMTEEESSKYWVGASEYFRELLSKGFDLFGLIEAGLAIDKTTLKQEV